MKSNQRLSKKFMISVHDNIIREYQVDFINSVLTIKTEFCDGVDTESENEKTDIVFTEYLTHVFYNETKYSIIFDVYELPSSDFIKEEQEVLEKRKHSGWPIFYKTPDNFAEELSAYLKNDEYKTFCISSSLGLNGWVIAKKMDFIMLSTQ